jgi:hypothetical protein
MESFGANASKTDALSNRIANAGSDGESMPKHFEAGHQKLQRQLSAS